MSVNVDQTAEPFGACFVAEVRRRWWQMVVAIGGVAAGVVIVRPVDKGQDAVGGAILIATVLATLFGALSFARIRGQPAEGLPEVPRRDRRRRYFAAAAVGLLTCLGMSGAAIIAAGPPSVVLEALMEGWIRELQRLALGVSVLSLAGCAVGFAWSASLRGRKVAMLPALASAAAACLAVFELLPLHYLSPRWGRAVPTAALVFPALLVLGLPLAAYRSVVVASESAARLRRHLTPVLVLVAAGVAGFGVQAGLAAHQVHDRMWSGAYERAVPDPTGRRVALLASRWIIVDAADGTPYSVNRCSWSFGYEWSPDGRYFLYSYYDTPRDIFLRHVLPRHFGRRPGAGILDVRHAVYDTHTRRSLKSDLGDARFMGWTGDSQARFSNTGEGLGFGVRVFDREVETGRTDRRVIRLDVPSNAIRLAGGGRRYLALVEEQRGENGRVNARTFHLLNLRTGEVIRRPWSVTGRLVGGVVVSRGRIIACQFDVDRSSGRREAGFNHSVRAVDSRLIEMTTGRETLLRGEARPGFETFWVPEGGRGKSWRWIHVTRHGRGDRRGRILSGLLDVQTGEVHSRPDWPGSHEAERVVPSDPPVHWLILPRKADEIRRVWTLPMDDPEAPFTEHDLISPADDRVSAPEEHGLIVWVTDTELCFLSRQRHLVFYDVVEKRRTKVVSIE